jgi:hypothetical protein
LNSAGGDVTGPASATADAPAVFNGTTGKIIKNSTPTGTGNPVLQTSPTLITPLLGTPTSGNLATCTGLPISTGVAGLGANVATFLGTPSSANLIAAVTDETGTGALVFANTPTLVTAVLGSSTATTQAPADNSTKVATTAYVDAAVAALGGLAGTKVYYVSDTNGGAVDRKLTFTNGILTAET